MGARALTPAGAQKGRGERTAEIKNQKTLWRIPPRRMRGDSRAFEQLSPLLRRTYLDSGNNGSTSICHNRDRTYPYRPYPDLSMPTPSHLNHSRAPNTKPEPSDPLASQQRTPEHSDPLASSQRIPDPTHPQPFLSLTSSRFPTPTPIPDPTLIQPLLFLASRRFPTTTLIPDPTSFDLHSFASNLFPMFHRSRDCGRAKPNCIPPSLNAS